MQKVVGRLARRGVFLVLMVLVGSCGAESEGEMTPPADGADVEIIAFVGAGVQLEFGCVVIHVDPWSRGDYSNAEKIRLLKRSRASRGCYNRGRKQRNRVRKRARLYSQIRCSRVLRAMNWLLTFSLPFLFLQFSTE